MSCHIALGNVLANVLGNVLANVLANVLDNVLANVLGNRPRQPYPTHVTPAAENLSQGLSKPYIWRYQEMSDISINE
jgi:hypothetical protein